MRIEIDVSPFACRSKILLDDKEAGTAEVVFDLNERWAMPYDDEALQKYVRDKEVFLGQLVEQITERIRYACLSVGAAEIMTEDPRPGFELDKYIAEDGYGDG